MTTSASIPVSQYLATTYRPDCDYVDGQLQERNLGELDHSDLQSQLLDLLRTPENRQYLHANPELRVQVSSTRFRVPDVCVRSISAPREQVIRNPPLLCIEVLSPSDTVFSMRERIRDFLDMGVQEVWLIDADARTVILCSGNKMVEHNSGQLAVPGTPVVISIDQVFSVLDQPGINS
jgi:Uma2 family endonuclease